MGERERAQQMRDAGETLEASRESHVEGEPELSDPCEDQETG